ncbi:MAG: transposase [Acidobacteriota bacterium]
MPDLDHAHILCSLSRSTNVSGLLRRIKESSSKWAKTKGEMMQKFQWQGGYAAFSVSASRLNALHRYIRDQERHHQAMSFQEELLKFLKEYHSDHDERYLWD